MYSEIFQYGNHKAIEDRILHFFENQIDFLSVETALSPRAVGDAMQGILAMNFKEIIGNKYCNVYSDTFARRAMADLAFTDHNANYYIVDVKTHRLSTKFNMPNLTSVERISRFYEDDKNYFVVLILPYDVDGISVKIGRPHFVPIEFLSWDCLTLGALGWGQIQIANSNKITIAENNSRREWMIQLFDELLEFYPKEIEKIGKRMDHFKKLREFWQNRT